MSLLLMLVVVVTGVPLSAAYPGGTAAGEMRSTGRPLGDFVLPTAECYAWGDLSSPDAWVVRKLERPLLGGTGFRGGLRIQKGDAGHWRVVTESPIGCVGFKCRQHQVDARHCSLFDVVSETRGWLWRRSGHARLDCTFPEGGTLKADLTFSGCAQILSSNADADL